MLFGLPILILKHLENCSKQREFCNPVFSSGAGTSSYAAHQSILAKAVLEAALPADKQCLLILNQVEVPTTSLTLRTIYPAVFPADQLIQQHHVGYNVDVDPYGSCHMCQMPH
jgi:hypothetical protein